MSFYDEFTGRKRVRKPAQPAKRVTRTAPRHGTGFDPDDTHGYESLPRAKHAQVSNDVRETIRRGEAPGNWGDMEYEEAERQGWKPEPKPNQGQRVPRAMTGGYGSPLKTPR